GGAHAVGHRRPPATDRRMRHRGSGALMGEAALSEDIPPARIDAQRLNKRSNSERLVTLVVQVMVVLRPVPRSSTLRPSSWLVSASRTSSAIVASPASSV